MPTTISKDELLDAIGGMTVLELADFIETFKTKFNVTIAAPVAAAPAGGAGGGGGGAPGGGETGFQGVPKDAGPKKIQVIKVVREVTSLGLKEAKDLVDNPPSVVKDAVAKAE